GESATYNIPAPVRLRGPLDAEALRRALEEIVRRHEALRTVFRSVGGRAAQLVLAPERLALYVADLSPLPEAEQAAAVRARVAGDAARPFDLENGPLFRASLLRLGADEHVLLLCLHHIVSDGWSMGVLFREMEALYGAYASGEASPLPPLEVQYPDYAVWQRKHLVGEVLEAQLAYWKERLAGAPALLELPTDRPRPAVESHRGAMHLFRLPAGVTDGLKGVSRREGATLFMTLLGAFQLLLSRYSGQEDVVVGTPIAGRRQSETETLIGFFVNTLVVRTDLAGAASFREVLRSVREAALGAYAHQELPFERLIEELQVERSLSRHPLFQVMFVLQDRAAEGKMAGLGLEAEPSEGGVSRFDLTLSMREEEGGMAGMLEYATDLFDAATIEGLAGHFRVLLEGIAADPDRRLRDLSLLRGEEIAGMVETGSTPSAGTTEPRVHQLVEARAARAPDQVALVCGAESFTYAELSARANRLAHHLRDLGVGPEARVGIWLERTPDLVVAILAVLKAGGAYVPVDTAYPEERVSRMLRDARAVALVTRRETAASLPELPGTRRVYVDADAARIAARPAHDPETVGWPESLAYVIYTSGSTGTPKGVQIEHRNTVAFLRWMLDRFPLEPGARVLGSTSVSFDVSVAELFFALAAGGTLVLVENALALAGLGEDAGIVHASMAPAAAAELLRSGGLPRSLRTLNLGGEAIPPALAQALCEAGLERVGNGYGPTEDTTYSTFSTFRTGDGRVTIGHPVAGGSGYVLDAGLNLLPVGVPGELYLGGEGVTRGYFARPELTAERYLPDPFAGAGARMYRTGDRVRRLPTGELEYFGRNDFQVKVRGFRIELGEIEAALLDDAEVRQAVVVVREDQPGQKRLVAYVVPADGATPTAARLREALGRRLPEYMVPAACVMLEALPLNPNGKTDRAALPAPELDRVAGFEAPRTAEERVLAGIWEGLLGVSPVGAHDNFFELGGDSILSIQVIARAAGAGLVLTPRQIFQHQTVAAMAEAAGTAPRAVAEQGTVTGEVPLTPVQRWFFEQALPEAHHWNQSFLLEVRERVRPEPLERALAALALHHDVLRLRYRRTEAGWTQRLADADGAHLPLEVVELAGTDEAARGAALQAHAERVQAGLELEHGPIARAVLFEAGDGRAQRLLLVVHHLAVDGVSWRILLEDLEAAYAQAERGEGVKLPAKTTSFRAWAERLEAHGRSAALGEELAYWAAREEGAPLPVDHAGGRNTEDRSGVVRAVLPESETRALLVDVPSAYRTRIDDVLLCALARTLGGWIGKGRVRVALEGHGREDLFEDVDLSRTVGWFTSLYPVCLEVEPDAAPGEALKRVKEQLRAVPAKGIGYGVLRYLGTEAAREALAAATHPQVSFNYLGQYDQTFARSRFTLVPEAAGSDHAPGGQRAHLLDVVCCIREGKLELSWSYGEEVHDRSTVERLAGAYLEALREIVAHCVSPEAGGYTPSDFPLSGLDQEGLDALLDGDREVADLYALAPMQQGMLFHSLHDADAGSYLLQTAYLLEGPLDARSLERAWQRVVMRHPVLRTVFLAEGLDTPLQLVRPWVELPWRGDDWSGLSPAEQEARIQEHFRTERECGLPLDEAPLMRVALCRAGEGRHWLLWSIHHLLIDGWSLPLLMAEVMSGYDAFRTGGEPRPEPVRPYRDYVAWLGAQDLAQAERFWRGELAGFRTPTPLPAASPAGAAGAGYAERELRLDAGEVRALQELARRAQVTLNTVVQGAWALLLGRHSGEDDVVFGSVVSERPATLAGAERMVGLFINTLPVRTRVRPGAGVAEWLREMQERQVEARQYEHTPLVEVHGWSEVPRGHPLFESIVVFENQPDEASLHERGEDELRITDVRAVDRTSFPLTLKSSPGTEMPLQVSFDRARVDEAGAERLLGHLRTLLGGMAAAPDAILAELPLLPEAERAQVVQGWNATDQAY
ncbi:MAG: amino acid adenylation domain-containing protein, partial [Gemmatimonadetes bacterium]|nr:amino acid adenylation domain-containing protein [Gemmatimonadota bacterium]